MDYVKSLVYAVRRKEPNPNEELDNHINLNKEDMNLDEDAPVPPADQYQPKTEAQMRQIIQDHNEYLNSCSKQIERLQKEESDLDQELTDLKTTLVSNSSKSDSQVKLLKQQVKNLKLRKAKLQVQMHHNEIAEVKGELSDEESKIIEDLKEVYALATDGEESQHIFDQIFKIAKHQQTVIKVLKETQEELQEKLKEPEERKCLICGEMAKPDQDDCYRHIGQMRFFSCYGCGGDEYYNCCGKCQKCSPGCRKQAHVFE